MSCLPPSPPLPPTPPDPPSPSSHPFALLKNAVRYATTTAPLTYPLGVSMNTGRGPGWAEWI